MSEIIGYVIRAKLLLLVDSKCDFFRCARYRSVYK